MSDFSALWREAFRADPVPCSRSLTKESRLVAAARATSQTLRDKRFLRKHGPAACYGQTER